MASPLASKVFDFDGRGMKKKLNNFNRRTKSLFIEGSFFCISAYKILKPSNVYM